MVIRTTEQKKLEQYYGQSGNQLLVLYGREGSEKERLLASFCRDKKSFFYKARNVSPKEQFIQLQKEIVRNYDVTLTKNTYDECFNRIKSGDASKLVVIIDGVEHMMKKERDFWESVLKLKAKKLYPGPVMIILCSTALSWSTKELPAIIGEDVKKVDEFMKLSDVTFLDVVRGFPEYSVAECTEAYGILGGVPAYLNRWNGKKSIKENICQHILSPRGFLFAEAEHFLGTELRELSVYETILASIASGNEKLNDLYLDTGYSRAKISVYMKNLAAFDVIEKVVSFETGGWDNAKKGVYRIANNYVNFWFTFVYPHLSQLYTMTPEEFYDAYIEKELEEYLHRYFVDVCGEYLQLMNLMGKIPLRLTQMGTWVGKQGTIDIIGQNSVRENVVGICNWDKKELTLDDYKELLANMKRAKISAKVYYLFSAKSFDADLIALAKEHSEIVLVDMKEL